MSNLVILKGVFLLLFGCFANNIFLELVIKVDPACGPSLTLCQFLFIVVTLLPSNVNKQRVIPLWFYIISTAMFFIVSYLNNLAFNFHISQPVHMVARSSSLAVSFIVGLLFFKSKFDRLQLFSVLLVTAGILITLSAEADSKARQKVALQQMDSGCSGVGCAGDVLTQSSEEGLERHNRVAQDDDLFYWGVGIAMLFIALTISSFLGHLQSYDMWHHFALWSSTPGWVVPILQIDSQIPEMWVWVSLNVAAQWLCISGVYILMSHTSALTVTLLLTLRKFLSLLFSVWYFDNPFTTGHWIGVACVFVGAILYK